jgi:hypothetical protein
MKVYYGAVKVYCSLTSVKRILLNEGFRDARFLQTWKDGQVFGLVKPLNDLLEVHVRGYVDNTLDAEVELSREYLEHPYDVKPFYGYLVDILRRHDVPYEIVKALPPNPQHVQVPKNPTRWKPLMLSALIISCGTILYFLSEEGRD